MITNSTNKMVKLKRGCVLAKIEPVDECNLTTAFQGKSPKTQPVEFSTIKDKIIVSNEHKKEIEQLIKHNLELFAEKDTDLGCTDIVKMTIHTGNHAPIKQRPFRTPLIKRNILETDVRDMLKANMIRHSRSPWASPVVVVDKKDGSQCFCVDFCQLNDKTTPSSWPLPVIDDLLALLGKAKYFTSLDLKSGYWQVTVDEKDKEKTAFTSHMGLYEFNVMPFGLVNAPSVFQRVMSTVLKDMSHFSLAYLDDVIIFSPTFDVHLRHIGLVFGHLKEHNLKMKISKCKFAQKQTQYLGFIVDGQGIGPDPEKVMVIRAMLPLENVREVRSFIGMCSF